MFFYISKILAFLINPIIWVFVLIFLALVIKKHTKKILFSSLLVFYIFSNEFISDSVSKKWEIGCINSLDETYDVAIVLGGISNYDIKTKKNNFNEAVDRIIAAEQLYRKGYFDKILFSGGNGNLYNNSFKEADIMKDHLIKNGISDSVILIENQSRNTKENAFNSTYLLNKEINYKKVLLITSALHMRRAKLCFDQTNIRVDIYSTDCTSFYNYLNARYMLIPSAKGLRNWEKIIHEILGYYVYYIIL